MRLRGALFLCLIPTSAFAEPVAVQLESRDIKAKDIAVDAPVPERILIRIAAPQGRLLITAADQKNLLRRHYPGLVVKRRYTGDIQFVAQSRRSASRFDRGCYILRHDVSQGDYVTLDDFGAIACDATVAPVRLGYDKAARALFARTDLPAFSYAGRIVLPSSNPVQAGTAMTLRTVSGPVTIDRSVVTLQSSRSGHRIFVRTKDGEVLTHPLADIIEERSAQ